MSFFRVHMIVLATALLTAPASGQAIISFDFAGGTIADYVDAVRRAAGEVNIVVSPTAEAARIEPVTLTKVSLQGALKLIEGQYAVPGRAIEVRFQSVSSGNPALASNGELMIYKLDARPTRGPDIVSMVSHVWSLAPILDADHDPQHVLTAIEAALDLEGEVDVPTKLRFHRETRLLLARGNEEQLKVIDSLLDQLRDQSQRAQRTKQTVHNQELAVDLANYGNRLDALEAERTALRKEILAIAVARDSLVQRIQKLEISERGR